MDFFLRNRWGIFEKQNSHSCEHFIFQNVLSFIIINFPCDTWLGIMGKKWKQKIMLGGGPMLINTHEEVRYILISLISGMQLQTHYLPYTFLLFSTNYKLPMMWFPNNIFILQSFIFKNFFSCLFSCKWRNYKTQKIK